MSHAAMLDERAANSAVPPGTVASTGSEAAPKRRGRAARFFLGSETDPKWARPALWGLLALSAVVYFWHLTNSGYANDFYAAAVKSGTKSWTAWLFGSLDSANSITVDKPPAALWVMVLSARIFGFSSFSLLLPEALMGIGTVATVHAAVRRWYGDIAGLVAGLLVLVTPVAAMMFRFDNPDAMLTLLMALAAYFVTRAIDTERGRKALWWMVAAGSAIGFAFLTKMLQGMLVLPGFVLAYLIAAPRSWKARFGHLFAALASMIVSAGWFVLLADLWPSASRPYIGGSTNNSEWELALGYNGLGRLLGGSGNAGGMGGGGGGFGGTAGILRMFNSQFRGEISWFLPASLILLVAGLVACGKAPRTDKARAGLVIWGGWLLSTALVLSFMQGTVHSYYSIALAPGIAATAAIGAVLVARKAELGSKFAIVWRTILGLAISVTAGWGFHLMYVDAPTWHSWIRWTALLVGVLGAMAYVGLATFGLRKFAVAALLVSSLAAVAPSASWTASTISVGHTGSMPQAGPASASTGMGGMGGGPGGSSSKTGTAPTGTSGSSSTSGSAPTGTAPSGTSGSAPTGTAPSGTSGSAPTGTAPSGTSGSSTSGSSSTGSSSSSSSSSSSQQGGMGGGMDGSSNSQLIAALNKTTSKWSAAVIGDQSAAGLILNSDTAVMAIGGWGGSDNNVTLAQFKQYVASGQITYFIAGGGMGGGQGGGTSSASEITSWVQANFKSTTIGGTTVYLLTQAK